MQPTIDAKKSDYQDQRRKKTECKARGRLSSKTKEVLRTTKAGGMRPYREIEHVPSSLGTPRVCEATEEVALRMRAFGVNLNGALDTEPNDEEPVKDDNPEHRRPFLHL